MLFYKTKHSRFFLCILYPTFIESHCWVCLFFHSSLLQVKCYLSNRKRFKSFRLCSVAVAWNPIGYNLGPVIRIHAQDKPVQSHTTYNQTVFNQTSTIQLLISTKYEASQLQKLYYTLYTQYVFNCFFFNNKVVCTPIDTPSPLISTVLTVS